MNLKSSIYDAETAVLRGVLKQQCIDSTGLFDWVWKRVNLDLSSGTLTIISPHLHTSLTTAEALLELNDSSITDAKDFDTTQSSLSHAKYAKEWSVSSAAAGYGFDLIWSLGEIWSFLAESEGDCRQWVEGLNICIKQNEYLSKQVKLQSLIKSKQSDQVTEKQHTRDSDNKDTISTPPATARDSSSNSRATTGMALRRQQQSQQQSSTSIHIDADTAQTIKMYGSTGKATQQLEQRPLEFTDNLSEILPNSSPEGSDSQQSTGSSGNEYDRPSSGQAAGILGQKLNFDASSSESQHSLQAFEPREFHAPPIIPPRDTSASNKNHVRHKTEETASRTRLRDQSHSGNFLHPPRASIEPEEFVISRLDFEHLRSTVEELNQAIARECTDAAQAKETAAKLQAELSSQTAAFDERSMM